MERKKNKLPINNAFYNELHEKWHEANDHPVALLRAENALRNPWIQSVIQRKFARSCSVLDVGCGAGFLTNALSKLGHEAYGIDLSEKSIAVARKTDITGKTKYLVASAYELPFPEQSFDVVCAMDLLEHVEKPFLVVSEASRVLKKGGLFFFHTFNRNLLSYLMIIKGVEWCFTNTPANMHVYSLFIKPKELNHMCNNHELKVEKMLGVTPDMTNLSFWKMVFKRKVDQNFRFTFIQSLRTGYSGYAIKT